MLIMAVDDEPLQLEQLEYAVKQVVPTATLRTFTRGSAALSAMQEEALTPDVVFLDIEMPGVTGMEMAVRIKEHSPRTNIVFVTGFTQYAVAAAKLHTSGYVVKPVTVENLRDELDNLRYPPVKTFGKRIRVQCFGDFEIFVDNTPVIFTRTKAKELLAFLVDRRGVKYTGPQIADILWDDGVYDRKRQILFSAIRSDMLKSLKKVNAQHIVYSDRQGLAVDTEQFDCDYYAALQGDVASLNAFMGQYMSSYSWAEFTSAALVRKQNQEMT